MRLRRRYGLALVISRRGQPLSLTAGAAVLVAALTGCGGAAHRSTTTTVTRSAGALGSVSIAATVRPSGAGTDARPQPVSVDLALRIDSRMRVEAPLVQSIDIDFPAGTRFGGATLPSCGRPRLARLGPSGCPAGSITGRGHASALIDTAHSPLTLTLVNGGASSALLYVAMDNPARVRQAVVGQITPAGGGYRVHLALPKDLQIVAGVAVALQRLELHAGREGWLATSACSGGAWRYRAAVRFADGTSTAAVASVPCH
jgi:hypothetical protein